jgi:hypothetical protein
MVPDRNAPISFSAAEPVGRGSEEVERALLHRLHDAPRHDAQHGGDDQKRTLEA